MQSRLTTGLAVLVFIGILVFLVWLGLPMSGDRTADDRLLVVTTIYPLADFVQNIGSEYVEVVNVVPAGTEPHEYEPTPREVAQVLEADVLIYLGGGLDVWAEDMSAEVIEHGGYVLGIEDEVTFARLEEELENESAADEHGHEGIDPHIWLDPVEAQNIVSVIADALAAVDAEHAVQYQARANVYMQELQELDGAYQASLASCELDDIIVSHDAFGYLARRYGFTIHSISGLSPEAEPSVRDLAELAETARALGVKTIFFETLVSPKLAETLAKEVGAVTAVLNPLEGLTREELEAGETYLTVMEKNRQALHAALLCQ